MSDEQPTALYAGVVVEVEWIDSSSVPGWQRTYDDVAPIVCQSVGYLHGQDDESVRIVQSRHSDGATAELLIIPRAVVRSVRELS